MRVLCVTIKTQLLYSRTRQNPRVLQCHHPHGGIYETEKLIELLWNKSDGELKVV